jgi:hypothetical protein
MSDVGNSSATGPASMPEPGPDDAPITLPSDEPESAPKPPSMPMPGEDTSRSPHAPEVLQDPDGVPAKAPDVDQTDLSADDKMQ